MEVGIKYEPGWLPRLIVASLILTSAVGVGVRSVESMEDDDEDKEEEKEEEIDGEAEDGEGVVKLGGRVVLSECSEE